MPVDNSFDDFIERFDALIKEADSYGIASALVLMDDDPINREETKTMLWSRGHMQTVGMFEYAKHSLLTMVAEKRQRDL
jgi:hypothetical protein